MAEVSPLGTVLLTGATGFVGGYVHDALMRAGWTVRAATRDVASARSGSPDRDWVALDVSDPASVREALRGCDAALYLVHGMASGEGDFRAAERAQAETFARAGAEAGLRRIVYLGGVAPPKDASEHLLSRVEVGEVLRAGPVSTIELRASMIVGHGSLSWLMVRDLAARLPIMVLPRWLESRTEPVAIDDVVVALVRALEMDVDGSAWFDVPGPDTLSGREILERTADALGMQRALMVEVPFLTPRLSSHWVNFVTRADWSVAREIVVGLKTDLVAEDDRFWSRIDHPDRLDFDAAARRAIEAEVEARSGDRDGGGGAPRVDGVWGFVERVRGGRRAGMASATIALALVLVLLWACGAFVARRVGLWPGLGTTTVLLGAWAWAIGRQPWVGKGTPARLVAMGALVGVTMAVATIGLFEPVTELWPALRADVDRLYEVFRVPGPTELLLMPLIVMFEEIVWRGAVQTALERHLPWASAAAAGTVLYAAAQLPAGSPALVLASLGAGLCWAILRGGTRSLLPALVAHWVWSFAVLVLYQLS